MRVDTEIRAIFILNSLKANSNLKRPVLGLFFYDFSAIKKDGNHSVLLHIHFKT